MSNEANHIRNVAALTPYSVERMHLNDAADQIEVLQLKMRQQAAEITRLRAELAEAVAMVNEQDAADAATCSSLQNDLDAWVNTEIEAGRPVPGIWDECGTSEWLASHLTSLGYARGTTTPTPGLGATQEAANPVSPSVDTQPVLTPADPHADGETHAPPT